MNVNADVLFGLAKPHFVLGHRVIPACSCVLDNAFAKPHSLSKQKVWTQLPQIHHL